MKTYYITPPNTCCLVESPSGSIIYTQNFSGPIEATDDATFEEFLTPEDALARAKEIDPNYDANNILGPLTVTLVSTSDLTPTVIAGNDITMSMEAECPEASVTYLWKDPDYQIIPGATGSSLTLSKVTSQQAGTYTGIGYAQNAIGQSGTAVAQFNLTVVETGTSL